MDDMNIPALAALRVLDLTDERGLLTGHMLAKLGADVVQIEPKAGSAARRIGPFAKDFPEPERSLFWSSYAAGKRSIILDPQDSGAWETLNDLARRADILIESYPQGFASEWGRALAALRSRHPHLITVSITAFGSDGPKADYAASDIVVWAAGGPLKPSRDGPGAPLAISAPQAWLHAAADAAGAALIAFRARERDGLGQHVEISAQRSAAQSTLSTILADAVGHADFSIIPSVAVKQDPKDLDLSGSGSRMRRTKWRVKDGLVEMNLGLGPAGGRFANNLLAWMRQEGALSPNYFDWDFVTLPERIGEGEITLDELEAVREEVANFFEHFTKAEMARKAEEHKLMLAPIMTTRDLLASEHHAMRGLLLKTPDGGAREHSAVGPFALGLPPVELRQAPRLGEHIDTGWEPRPILPQHASVPPRPALSGLKVLDFAWVVAGPLVSRSLADYGATVVRVESAGRIETARLMGPFPGGKRDPMRSALYDNSNAGKLGLALDLGVPEARQVALDLARWADVVVESFAPGQMERWGLGYETLSAANPGLVMLSTSLMGQSGPQRAVSGYGNIGAAYSGFQALVGREGADPVGPFGPFTDFVAPRFGLAAVLAALANRDRTGQGTWLDVSQVEAGIQLLAPQLAEEAVNGTTAKAHGNRSPCMCPHGVFRAAGEDQWVAIAVRDDHDWSRLAELIGGDVLSPDFRSFEGRKSHEERVEALVERWTCERSARVAEECLQAQGIPAHVVAGGSEMLSDPQLADHFLRLPHVLGGKSVIEGSRYRLSRTPAEVRRTGPVIGQDTLMILREFARYDELLIDKLKKAGALH